MARSNRIVLAKLAAALVALQALWSGLAATAYAAGIDEARFLCATVSLDADARAQLAELAALIDPDLAETPDPAFDPQDCPACSLGKLAALPDLEPTLVTAAGVRADAPRPPVRQFSPRQTTGPPVGLRAPPPQI